MKPGTADAIKRPDQLALALENEPIAVACCHILNDMRPLDTIVGSTYVAASAIERGRYLMAALAHYCFGGGVRYEIVAAATDRQGWSEQFQSAHPLPLEYFDAQHNFIVPLNSTLAERTLTRAPTEDVAKTFEKLALGIAARVNREAVQTPDPGSTARRTPVRL